MKPFFVHIPKNMGNFIYQKYFDIGHDFQTRYYGFVDSIDDYYRKYDISIPTNLPENYRTTASISIDHLTPLELLQLGIMNTEESKEYVFFAIVREPMERFISLCNYWDVPPIQLIYNISKIHLLKKTRYNLFQHLRPQSDYIADMKRISLESRVFSMNCKDDIRDFLLEYFPERKVDFGEKIYSSGREKYNISMLTRENIQFLRKYYRDDFALFVNISNK
jgi:hypothetical protein